MIEFWVMSSRTNDSSGVQKFGPGFTSWSISSNIEDIIMADVGKVMIEVTGLRI